MCAPRLGPVVRVFGIAVWRYMEKYEGTAGGHVLLARTTTSSLTGSSLLFCGCEGLVSVFYRHFPAEVVLKGRLNPLGPWGWRYSKDGQALVRIASASVVAHRSPPVSVLQRPLAGTGCCSLEVATILFELLS